MGWTESSVFQLLIVQSGQANTGLFVYNGVPAAGNPPVFSVVAPGITTDPFGNGVQAILVAGNQLDPRFLIDPAGNASVIATDGSALTLSPQVSLGIALTQALTGTILGQLSLTSSDVNETVSGAVADVVLGSGATAKMATLVMSPYGSTGMGMLLQAENDGSTDTALVTLGTITTQGFSLAFQPVLAVSPFAMVLYGSGATIVVVTHTSGSGTIPIPVGVSSAKAECWGGGGGGGQQGFFGAAGAGGGEYAAEPALAVTGGGTVAYAVGAAGSGGINGGAASTAGGNSTLTGSAVTVTAHGGGRGILGSPGAGGSGSGNTTHFSGGGGGSVASGAAAGSGGGGSGGTSSAGHAGHGSSGTVPGAGGTAVPGGGAGGAGANPGFSGGTGGAPGGAGGGGGNNGNGGNGARGQVRLTYSTGAPAVLMAVAQSAFTDQFGTSIQPGLFLAETATPATPTAGMSLYVDNTGHLHALGLSGTNTTLANP